MLKDLFPAASPRYLTLPIAGPLLADCAGWLLTQGYPHATRRKHIPRMVGVDASLQRHGHNTLKTLTLADGQACWQWYNRHHVHAASTVRVFQQYLTAHGCLPAPQPQPCSPSQAYLKQYTHYLQSVRGFAPLTIAQHRCTVTHLLEHLATQHTALRLTDLTASTLEQLLTCVGQRLCRATRQHVVAHIRGLLRFLALSGAIPSALAHHIDTPRVYRLEQLPRVLAWETVGQLLLSIDRTTPPGRRDYAMLLLMATYGLRNSDIVALTLEDIQWRRETLQLTQHKTSQPLVLPLTDAVGTALLEYLRHERPTSACRQLFLRARAPLGPLARTAVTDVFQAWASRSGLAIPFQGAHCLRHSYALHLLRQGVSLKAIGDVLGHRTVESTCGYLRLSFQDLRDVALPVPREESQA
jgi:integrase/recombinase XerD